MRLQLNIEDVSAWVGGGQDCIGKPWFGCRSEPCGSEASLPICKDEGWLPFQNDRKMTYNQRIRRSC